MSAVIESHFGLAEALSVGSGDVISLVGAGGKTTILYGSATELRRRGVTVVATTTEDLLLEAMTDKKRRNENSCTKFIGTPLASPIFGRLT